MIRNSFAARLPVLTGLLLLGLPVSSHDDTRGARFVDPDGVNASDCLEHHEPCRSIQFALEAAEPGNAVKVSAGIYDMSGIDPERFLFGVNHAQGGYEPGGHFDHQDADAFPTILVGVDPRYRQAAMRLGFKWAADLASAQQGIVDDSPAAALQATAIAAANCVQGFAGQFPCQNVDFQSQIALTQFSSQPLSAANVWGFVDQNDGREYAVVGLSDGTAVVEVTDPVNPRQVVTIPGNSSAWREVKIYQSFDVASNRFHAFAYITTEAPNSGLQVINLSGLPGTATLTTTLFDTGTQHTAYISNIDYATNLALPGQEAFLYVAGSNVGTGSWRVYSLADPAQPQFIAAAPASAQYVHDATSLLITDARTTQCGAGHDPCEVYVDFNESSVDLWDVTEKSAPILLSTTTYSDASYTHSGWPSADQRHIFIHDETEEIFNGIFTQIYTMNVEDLRNPFIIASYQGPDTTTDHNGYTKGSLLYVSHYRRGLVIFDASDPEALREVANFDTFVSPAPNSAGTEGAWGVYPFFPSGTVVVSDISNGLFVLRDQAAGLSQSAGRLAYVGATANLSESAANARLTVRRNGGFAGAVSIDYATSDVTATTGTDYTAVGGTLSWPAGDMSDRSIAIPIVNDSLDEPNENFRVTLANAGGGATIEGSATFDVVITNDDGVVVPPPGGGGGGGGGATDLALLGLISVLLLTEFRRRRRRYYVRAG